MGNVHTDDEKDTDGDFPDDDCCPGLIEESDDSDDEEPELPPQNCNTNDGSETEDEDIGASASASAGSAVQTKRTSDQLDISPNVDAPARKRRAMTHASKVECVDLQEIKACLNTQKCGCSKECMQKFKDYKERAVEAVEQLRLQRFAGNFCSPCGRSQPTSAHPGV